MTYGEACVQVGLLFVMTMVRNRERVHCVCQVCLSHLRLSAPYANGQGGWEGQLHGKLLVLIQHVEQRRRGVLFNKAPHLLPHQVVHTHSHPASVYAFERTPAQRCTPHANTEHLFLSCASKQTCFSMRTNPTILRPTPSPLWCNTSVLSMR